MEQRIRFCTTSDGVRIAYATLGQGPPLVRVLGWCTHLELEREFPNWESYFAGGLLAQNHLFVRYDGRGMGLSDRDIEDYSLDAKVRDLEAVIDALGVEKCAIFGGSEGGPTAIAYTVRHPDRVSRLVLYGSFARFPNVQEGEQQVETMISLIRLGWGSDLPAHRQFFTGMFMPDAGGEAVRGFTEFQRNAASAESVAALLSALVRIDVTDLLPRVNVPTLVIHRRNESAIPFESGRELAALIPGARFLPLEGRNHAMQPDEPENEVFRKAVEEFLAEDEKAASAPPATVSGAPLTILFTDMEGSTTLTQRLGDARAQELLRAHNELIREGLKAHGGHEIKHTGDGIMASFASASHALECAVAIQKAFASRNDAQPEEPVRVRIGLNAGEPVAEDEDLFGAAVQLAARVCAHAQPGQILASNVVRELTMGKGFLFSDQGDVALRGFEDPARLYEVYWEA